MVSGSWSEEASESEDEILADDDVLETAEAIGFFQDADSDDESEITFPETVQTYNPFTPGYSLPRRVSYSPGKRMRTLGN